MEQVTLPFNTILQGDCIEVLAQLPDNSVDLIFADPPYNLQLQQELWRPNMTKVDPVNDAWDQFDGFAAYDRFTRAWLQECRRILKENGTLWVIGAYHNIYRVGTIMMDLGFWMLNDILWIKSNPMPNFRGVRFTNAHETLLWAQKHQGNRYTFNYDAMKALNDDLQMRSDWYIPICSGAERIKVGGSKAHSTQKPEALLYRVILSSSKPGDVVLDPFFGTGTTGAVAKKLNRYWIGIERDPLYIEVAQDRIDAISYPEADDEIFAVPNRRSRSRIPFGRLLEQGLLEPGQKLYFQGNRSESATILANGHLRYKRKIGSIHEIARMIQGAPCNGWEHWYYDDPSSKKRLPIDVLREQLRADNDEEQELGS
jgi:DNA modification methylase